MIIFTKFAKNDKRFRFLLTSFSIFGRNTFITTFSSLSFKTASCTWASDADAIGVMLNSLKYLSKLPFIDFSIIFLAL